MDSYSSNDSLFYNEKEYSKSFIFDKDERRIKQEDDEIVRKIENKNILLIKLLYIFKKFN